MVKNWLLDLLAVCGASSVIVGVAMVYVPAALVVAGMMMLGVAVLGAKRWAS